MSSTIDKPAHYTHGRFQPIDVIEDWKLGFCLGNTLKYLARAGHKDDELQDLRKAQWYLSRHIEQLEASKTMATVQEQAVLKTLHTAPASGDVRLGLYAHYKGGLYLVMAVARGHDQPREFVIYRSIKDDRVYYRSKDEFLGTVNPTGFDVPRFAYVEDPSTREFQLDREGFKLIATVKIAECKQLTEERDRLKRACDEFCVQSQTQVEVIDMHMTTIDLVTKERDEAREVGKRLAMDALAALARAGICTPENGYLVEPGQLGPDINRLQQQRDGRGDGLLALSLQFDKLLAKRDALTAQLEAAEASNQRLKAAAAAHEAELDGAYAALLQSQGKVVVLERELAGKRIEARGSWVEEALAKAPLPEPVDGEYLFDNGCRVRLYGNFPNRWCAHGPGGTIIAGPGTIGFASPEEAAAALIEAGFTLSWCSGVKAAPR